MGLSAFLAYKAALKGVAVDPRHTSQECPRCGHTARGNRRRQNLFRCQACGFQRDADWVASGSIARRALAQGAGSKGLGCGQPAPMLGNKLTHLPLPAS